LIKAALRGYTSVMRRSRLARKSLLLVLASAALAVAARADSGSDDEPDVRNLFREGRIELDAGAGLGVFNDNEYLLLLVGGGYYLRDGLSVGASVETWTGSQPEIGDVSPQVRYVFLGAPWRFKPYAGAFYRRTFYDHVDPPLDSGGVRGGLVFPLNDRAYLTGGLVYEHYAHDVTNSDSTRDEVYPEFGLAFSF
jgi:hypothetical protein